MSLRPFVAAVVLSFVVAITTGPLDAQTSGSATEKKEGSTTSTETKASTPTPAYAAILKDATPKSGLWTVYQKGNNLFWEIGSSDLSSEYILVISISRGNIGHPYLHGGMALNGFGDDWVWQFRKVGES